MNINTFNYNEVGLNRFFGPLESKIMEILWEGSEMSIRDVQQRLEIEKAINFNTVSTVMNRLVKKEILKKRVQGRTSLFKPIKKKEQFLEEQSRKITENIMDEFGELIINHILESLEDIDQSILYTLEQRIIELKSH
ncbi:BlaI/MecI/CopY family transcriptional regulator [Metabacillus halosaccharovorans]|nr:BlaI/MecI/CopY family transcriptional regulator [Metabacillus halosaccharovorans]